MNIQLFYPSLLTLFRYSHENPDSDYIDVDLKTLFEDLRTDIGRTYNITRKLRIDRGTSKHKRLKKRTLVQELTLGITVL